MSEWRPHLEHIRTPPLAEIYDTSEQTPSTTDPVHITLNEAGTLQDVAHDADSSEVTFNVAGTYLVVLDCHVGRTSGASGDYIDIWLDLNESPLSNTRTRRQLRNPDELDEIGIHTVRAFAAGDVLRAHMQVSGTGSGIGLKTGAASGSVPAIPSANLKLVRLSD